MKRPLIKKFTISQNFLSDLHVQARLSGRGRTDRPPSGLGSFGGIPPWLMTVGILTILMATMSGIALPAIIPPAHPLIMEPARFFKPALF